MIRVNIVSMNFEMTMGRASAALRGDKKSAALHTAGVGNPLIAQVARTVLTIRHAIVIGPTPPGTGVMAPAT